MSLPIAEQLKDLRHKRAVIKGSLTRFGTHLENVQVCDTINSSQVIQLEMRIAKLESLPNEFDAVQFQIESLDEQEILSDERNTFEKTFYSLASTGKNIIEQFRNPDIDDQVSVSSKHSSEKGSRHSAPAQDSIKLPIIKLPKFSGDYNSWLEFRDTYLSLIHNNNNIGNIQKFHYLRASLEGVAAHIINSLAFSAENYSIAWDILLERYNNKKLLVHNHIKSIFNISKNYKESASGLRAILDSISKNMRSLQTLSLNTEHWDVIVIYILTEKLDPTTAREWEEFKIIDDLPTLEEFKTFLKGRAELLENLEMHQPKNKYSTQKQKTFTVVEQSCIICKQPHSIFNCADFQQMSINARLIKIRSLKLCTNCFKKGHFSKDCRLSPCRQCGGKHNTLLHFPRNENMQATTSDNPNLNNNEAIDSTTACTVSSFPSHVLLSTAIIQVKDCAGNIQVARALLDSGSQSNFISQNFCEKLGLNKIPTICSVIGIGNVESNMKFSCELDINSLHYSFNSRIRCLVLPKITDKIPSLIIDTSHLNIPNHLRLADPNFHKPGEIDILLGAGIFWTLICIGQIRLNNNNNLVAQKTKLGWVISGLVGLPNPKGTLCHFSADISVQNQLEKFWKVEDLPSRIPYSKEEAAMEQHFLETFKRELDGRFVVSLPLKEPIEKLGDSKQLALKRFRKLEYKFRSNPTFKDMYTDFMIEYEQLGHMTRVVEDNDDISFYLPHHGVLKEDSLTTKLRVVFDGSAQSDSGYSLNNLLMVGPKIQDDLFDILLRFRKHLYVVCADIAKMYRQVKVDSRYTNLQCIIWRSDPNSEIFTYRLNTVTYGTSSASFLAIRCLKQLSIENEEAFPVASSVIARDFYVDDLLTGGNTVAEIIQIGNQVSNILKSSGFELRKWCSNNLLVLEGIHNSMASNETVQFGDHENTKTLGLLWSPQEDTFRYQIRSGQIFKSVTKRVILSEISQIFDPLGLLSPCTIIAKIILQKLWILKLSWDESISGDLHTEWTIFKTDLLFLNSLKLPRHVLCKDCILVECHGFSDSSRYAYGGSLYLRSVDINGYVHVRLLCAKSKVAPIKTLTIPRLELCGALVLARLFLQANAALSIKLNKLFFWTDSSIVLAWIKSPPNLYNTFVGNRISEIQTITDSNDWYHISSSDNPADILSRGLNPRALQDCTQWWSGPRWLLDNQIDWPLSTINSLDVEIPEMRKQVYVQPEIKPEIFPFERFSSLSKLKRITAYCLRFIHNCRVKRDMRKVDFLTTAELEIALLRLVKMSQVEYFSSEIKDLVKNGCVSLKNKLTSLAPFIDSNGIILVGGRLKNSNFSIYKKHPMLLAKNHYLTRLIFKDQHLNSMHAGPQLLLSLVRNKFWPLSGRNLARKVVHDCVRCARFTTKPSAPLMGNLPKERLSPTFPFCATGLDYAGPFSLRDKKGRGYKIIKSYICLFVCFSTKAIHLELVTDLTKDSFIAAFRRFVSRRGKPLHIFSDNGSNFIGGNTQLKELGQFLIKNHEDISNTFVNEDINWHFIPAYSPHFGGLWEAGVKSTKFHIKRVLANALLTFEDFYTILTQIESTLNSRPLTPLSTDPNDYEPLTPAHFLIGRSSNTLPDPDVLEIQTNRLSRFQYLQKINQHFWKRWSQEYISQMQQRSKWRSNKANFQIGSLVLIKENNVPPGKWMMGRIVELHPGSDAIVRVVSIKTQAGIIKRSFSKVCPLPIEEETDNI